MNLDEIVKEAHDPSRYFNYDFKEDVKPEENLMN